MNEDLIYDVGMDRGNDTDFYLKKGFQVVAVDANPKNIQAAQQRFSEAIKAGRLTLVWGAVSDSTAKRCRFYMPKKEWMSQFASLERSLGSRAGAVDEVDVPVIRMKALLECYGTPYYLKVDIEGADYHAISFLESSVERPKYISVENGHESLSSLLYQSGYRSFKWVNQGNVQQQNLPTPALEGQEIQYCFAAGSSGAFGEEAPGQWCDYDSVRQTVETYWNTPNRDASVHGWFDLHAKYG